MNWGLKWFGFIACVAQANAALSAYYDLRDGGLIPADYAWVHALGALGWFIVAVMFARAK